MLPLLLPPISTPHPLPVHQHNISLQGYQLYAVEKWLLQRDRSIHLLIVYTGDPEHTIHVDALLPVDGEPNALWQQTIEKLRKDGAKPRHTPHGIVMATSLAHFPSEYTIVRIPSGSFLEYRDKLFSNINILRMGCGGRTALTLEDPSDSTKDRFLTTYHLSDVSLSDPPPSPPLSPTRSQSTRNVRPTAWKDRGPNHSTSSLPTKVLGSTKDPSTFRTTVLELVKLVQAALSLFGLYSAPIDGLLCDTTVDAIRSWTNLYGGPFAGLEPSERVADPMFVSAIFSLVVSLRNKLVHLGYAHVLPRDPFLYTYAFTLALTTYAQSTAPLPHHSSHSYTLSVPLLPMAYTVSHHSPLPSSTNTITPSAPGTAVPGSSSVPSYSSTTTSSLPMGSTFTYDLVESINAAYDKSKADHHSSKVKRVLKNRLVPPLSDHHHHHHHHGHRSGALGESDSAMDDPSPRRVSNNLGLSVTLSSGSVGVGGVPVSAGSSFGAGGGGSERERGGGGPGSGGSNPVSAASASALDSPPLQSSGTGGIGSSGGQIFTGIGSLASGLVLGPNLASHGSGMSIAELVHPTVDLGLFVRILLAKESGSSGSHHHHNPLGRGRKSRDSRRESADFALGYSSGSKGEKDASIAGSLRALWSGRVGEIVKMREIEADLDLRRSLFNTVGSDKVDTLKSTSSWKRPGLPMSDDEVERRGKVRYDGKSTEDDNSDAPLASGLSHFGGFSGRVKGKIGDWTALARRKHQSVDLSPKGKERPNRLMIPNIRPPMVRRSTAGGSRAQSPTLPPFADGEDEELLSSGQVSPLSDNRPNAFNMIRPTISKTRTYPPPLSPATTNSTSNLTSLHSIPLQDSERTFAQLLARKKRPWEHRRLSNNNTNASGTLSAGGNASGTRISSWADPLSARDFMDDYSNMSGGDMSGPEEGKRQQDGQRRGRVVRDDLSLNVETEIDSDVSGGGGGGSGLNFKSGLGDGPELGSKWKRRDKARFHSLLSVVDGDGFLLEEPLEEEEEGEGRGRWRRRQGGGLERDGEEDEDEEGDGYDNDEYYYYDEVDEGGLRIGSRLGIGDEAVGAWTPGNIKRRRKWFLNPRRRWSFHDIEDFRDIDDKLTVDRMKIDVNLCGQLLVMLRREEQTRTMMQCMKVLVNSIQSTNALIRDHYESHFDPLSEIEGRSRIFLDMEQAQANADRTAQATHTLRYEAEQFHTPDLWHTASQSRRKVFELREKVFGMGGRRLPPGVHGAHGGYNRLQWTLDGEGRLVDSLGRTESEAEEENKVVVDHQTGGGLGTSSSAGSALGVLTEGIEEEDDADVVEHPGIKPMWLLRFFTGWSARWTAAAGRGVGPGVSSSANAAGVDGSEETVPTSPPPGDGDTTLLVSEKGKNDAPTRALQNSDEGSVTSPGSFKSAASDESSPPVITLTSS